MPNQRDSGTAREPSAYDSWLRQYHGDLLEALDIRCRDRSTPDYEWFRHLDDDLWAILLSKHYSLFPNLRQALPDLPAPELQRKFNGQSGIRLQARSKRFYGRLKELYDRHGSKPLSESRVLDFGCGWGRLTRYPAKDIAPGNLFGCDPNSEILAVCERTRVPARLTPSEPILSELPFQERFDLIFAHSVFTHLSEEAHEACLKALHPGLERSGVLILTVRPAAFITDGLADGLGDEEVDALMSDQPAYAFAPQRTFGGAYGDAVINLPYIRERWGELFSVLDVAVQLDEPYQVVVTLRRRDAPGVGAT